MFVLSNIINSTDLEWIVDLIVEWTLGFGKNLLIAIVIFIVGKKIIKQIIKLVNRAFEKSDIEPIVIKFLNSLIRFALYGIIISMLIGILGIPGSAFIAVLSTMGLAIGLALQGSLSNFAGGVLILLFKPFKIGDYIKEDTHANEGTVTGIDLFYTKMLTFDNKAIVVPNGTLANSSLTNYTAQEKRRLDLVVGIGYGSDIQLAKKVLEQIVLAEMAVIKTEDYIIAVDNLGASSVDLVIKVWVSTADYWTAKWSLTEAIKLEFDKNDIEIPFQQISLIMNQDKA